MKQLYKIKYQITHKNNVYPEQEIELSINSGANLVDELRKKIDKQKRGIGKKYMLELKGTIYLGFSQN